MTESGSPLDLALVIPVWNDAEGVARLVEQARDMGVFSQIVVVDDGSDVAITVPDATLIRHESPHGAGPARNAGLASVTSAHVLFFDADDLLTEELPHLCADLAGTGVFDLCLFSHADSRCLSEPRWGQPHWEVRLWAEAGCAVGVLQEVRADAVPVLAQTANYPWNKIYRTAFLRDHAIGCGTTRLHEDIALHWRGFMAAGRVLASDRICALHHVAEGAGRQTNLMGPERLVVFAALEPVADHADRAEPRWQAAFAAYVLVLVDWIAGRLEPALRPELEAAMRHWLSRRVVPWLADMTRTDPVTAQTVMQRLE